MPRGRKRRGPQDGPAMAATSRDFPRKKTKFLCYFPGILRYNRGNGIAICPQTKGHNMKVSEARAAVGGLSKTSKMPCKSWGISAKACKTGSKLAKVEGTVCHGCYALKGAYVWPVVEKAHAKRLDAIYTTGWVDAMVTAINGDKYFRWFDSGDIQSDEHLTNIVRVAIATPNTKHWLPTKEYLMISRFMRKHGSFPKNLVVRVSSPNIDQAPVKHYRHTSTVHTGKPFGRECIAHKQDNECKDCRACWNPRIKNISYKYH